jgi:glycosyltransferase involved in cell wall biosynthesis
VARDTDFDVTVAAPRFFHGDLRPVENEPEPADSRLKVVPIDTRLSKVVHLFTYDNAALTKIVREGDFDVVHAWEEPFILAGYQVARALRKSRARFCFRTAQSYVKRYPPPFSYFERKVRARAQGWIAGASLVREAMLQRGFPAAQGRVLNLAVDLGAFKPLSDDEKGAVRKELGLDGLVIGFVGRLAKDKGLDVLMSALGRLPKDRSWSLLLLGSGDYREKVMSWAEQNGLHDRVKVMLVKHAEMPRFLGSMDMMVAPSQTMKNWREQFGRMLIEAFAAGVPVIGSDSGEIPFVIADAGKVVPEADIAGWSHAIDELLTSPELRADYRARGLVRTEKYSVATIAAQYRDFYRWLSEQPLGA